MTSDQPEGAVSTGPRNIDAITLGRSIADESPALLRDHFELLGQGEPKIVWAPTASDFNSPVIRSFVDVCDAIGSPNGVIEKKRFGLDAFDGLDRWLLVVDREGEHYRYTHYGAEIREHYQTDMTGSTTADFGSPIGNFFAALYHAAAHRKERVLSEHEPPMQVFVRLWRRLIVPLVDDNGQVTGHVAANVPENELRAGLEMIVDAVLVTDKVGTVQYANNAARQLFRVRQGPLKSLRDLTGLDLFPMTPPEVLLARREVIERIELIEHKSGLIDRVALTVSAAEHRGQAYYVIMVRPVERG